MFILDKESFEELCNKGKCPKHQRYNPKTCIKQYRKDQCYSTYVSRIERQTKKIEDTLAKEYDFIKEVWLNEVGFYDNTSTVLKEKAFKICSFWKILTDNEKKYIIDYFKDDFDMNFRTIEVNHIDDKSLNPSKKYDLNNVFLGSHYFHDLLTKFKHPVTRENISKKEVDEWNRAAKSGIRN